MQGLSGLELQGSRDVVLGFNPLLVCAPPSRRGKKHVRMFCGRSFVEKLVLHNQQKAQAQKTLN